MLLFMSPCHIQHAAMLAALLDSTFKGKFFAKEADIEQLVYENWHLELNLCCVCRSLDLELPQVKRPT